MTLQEAFAGVGVEGTVLFVNLRNGKGDPIDLSNRPVSVRAQEETYEGSFGGLALITVQGTQTLCSITNQADGKSTVVINGVPHTFTL